MPIDSNLYLQAQQQAPDLGSGIRQGMNMRQMAMNQDAQKKKMAVDEQQRQLEMIGRVAPGIKDQASYESALGELGKHMDTSQMPKAYDANLVQHYANMALTAKDQADNKIKADQLASNEADRQENRLDRKAMFGQQIEDRREGRYESRQDRISRERAAKEEKDRTLTTPFGMANTPDDAKQLKEAWESKNNFDGKIQEMIDLRKKHGGGAVLNREDVSRGKQLSKDLLLEYKNMAKLGVLSKSDEDIINAIIPEDPLQYNSPLAAIQGQDPTLNRLQKFKGDSDKDFSNRVATRTRSGVQTAATRQQGPQGFDPDVLAYAEKHNISPEDANRIKMQRTGTQTAGR